jgi:uroporphyrinogen decarboxylase
MWSKTIPAQTRLNPYFEKEIIKDDGEHQIIYDENRIKCEVFSDGTDSIPHYIDFPIKNRETYLPFKERLVGALEGRLPDNLAEIGRQTKDRNYVLVAPGGSTAGYIRNLMGFEGICLGLYDQPELIQEILDDLCAVSCHVAKAITEHIEVDLVSWWEDIAYRSGPIVTPKFFNEQCGRVYGDVMAIYQQHGTKYGYVDCDGDFRKIMPGWLNNGVNIMFPLEVNAGIHPDQLRKDHPGIRMMGGVDKVVLIQGQDAIKHELERLKPLVEEGGFIPHVDHRVQADVSFNDYLYYLKVKRDLFEIPNQRVE